MPAEAPRLLRPVGSAVVPSPERYEHWKAMYAVRHNWTVGNAIVAGLALPRPPAPPPAVPVDDGARVDGCITAVQCTARRVLVSRRDSAVIAVHAPADGRLLGRLVCDAAVACFCLAAAPWPALPGAEVLPDGRGLLAVVGLADGRIEVWDVEAPRRLVAQPKPEAPGGGGAPVVAVALTDRFVAAVSADQTLAIWACDGMGPEAAAPAAPACIASLRSLESTEVVALRLETRVGALARGGRRHREARQLRLTLSYTAPTWRLLRGQLICCQVR